MEETVTEVIHDENMNREVGAQRKNAMDENWAAEIHNERMEETGAAETHVETIKERAVGIGITTHRKMLAAHERQIFKNIDTGGNPASTNTDDQGAKEVLRSAIYICESGKEDRKSERHGAVTTYNKGKLRVLRKKITENE